MDYRAPANECGSVREARGRSAFDGRCARDYDRDDPRYRSVGPRFPEPRSFHMGRAGARPVFARRSRLREKIALVVVVAVVIAGALGAATSLSRCVSALAAGDARSGETSTPVSEWRAGEVPFLYQTDPAWADEPYAGGTVAENGCGPTCLTMAYVCATGRADFDPGSMSAFSERNGFVDQGMTAWTLMTDGAAMLGLDSEELPASESALRDALAAGRPVIASVGAGDFTTTGHFIVVAGADDDGRLVVRDPNSAERSAQTWDAQRVLSQCLNLWAISAR